MRGALSNRRDDAVCPFGPDPKNAVFTAALRVHVDLVIECAALTTTTLPAAPSSRMILRSWSRLGLPATSGAESEACRLLPLRGKRQRNPNNIARPS